MAWPGAPGDHSGERLQGRNDRGFHEEIDETCPDCEGSGWDDGDDCQLCKGRGELSRPIGISWTSIKAIHRRIVEISAGHQGEGD
jgi:DnaJ-class molecular chaperone